MRNINYREIVANSPMGFAYHKIICDKNGNPVDYEFIEVNSAFEKYTGLRNSAIIGKKASEVLPGIKSGSFDWIEEYGQIALNGLEKEFTAYSEDLKKYYLVKAYSDETYYFITIFTDITALELAKIELEKSKSELERYIEEAPFGILLVDENRNCIMTNREACRISGYSKEELVGMNWLNLLPEDTELEEFKNIDKNKIVELQVKYINKQEEERYWNQKGVKLADNKILCFIEDITDKKELETKIYYEQKLMGEYQDTANIMFVVIGRDERIESINKEGCKMLGLEEHDVLGKNWFDNFIPIESVDEIRQIFKKVVNGESENVKLYENSIITSNGEEKVISWHNAVLKDEAGEVISVLSAGNDITYKKIAERALQESEEKFRYIFDNSAIGKTLTLCSGEMQVNNTFCNMLEYTKEELAGRKWQEITHPDDIELSQMEVNKLLEGKAEKIDFEKRYLKKDGTVLWAEIHSAIRTDTEGNFLYFITSVVDITKRKQAEQAFQETQAFLKAAFDNSQAGIAIADAPDGKLRYVNSAGLLIRGKSEDELVSDIDYNKYADAWNACHLDGTPYKNEEIPLARAVLFGEEVNEEFIIKRDDGENRVVLANAGPIKDENNNIIAGIVVFLDITERKEIENQIIQNNKDILESQRISGVGTWRLNIETNEVKWSDELYKIYGFDSSLPPPPFTEHMKLFTSESWNRLYKALEATRTLGIPYELELETISRDGTPGWMWARGEAERNSDGEIKYIWGAAQDITARKKLEEERLLLQAQITNQQKLESIGTLASGVAHEINNPINGILNYGQIILDETKPDSYLNTYAGEIINETNRVAEIVMNLLDFSRQSGKEHSYANMEDIVSKTLLLIKTILKHDNIALNLDIADGLPKIKCRSQQIQQVLLNLITNARDSLNDKYPKYHENKKISLKCSELNRDDRKWISITVEDNGNGIPEEVRSRIFDPFFTTKKADNGTGLGLYISYGIIKEHHGEISFKSVTGEYTRFIVVLPCDNGWDIEN